MTNEETNAPENGNMYYYDDPLLDVLERIESKMEHVLEHMHRQEDGEHECCRETTDVPSTT